LLLSLSATALIALLVDLGKQMHQLNLHADRSFASDGERPARNQPNLSRSVG
jgi:hypothetical protein